MHIHILDIIGALTRGIQRVLAVMRATILAPTAGWTHGGIAKLTDAVACAVKLYGDREPLPCLKDAGLLLPDPESLPTNASIAGRGHEMAPWTEMAVDP
jgi:hypothetical protein